MTDTREEIMSKLLASPVPTLADLDADSTSSSDDEIIAAIVRQLDVLEGTAVVLGNMIQMLVMQIGNLRAEVGLFSQPPEDIQSRPPTPPAPTTEPTRTPTGHWVEATVPEAKQLPDFCLHDDALIVDTVDGRVRVCPTCDDD